MSHDVNTELIDADELRAKLSEFALEGPTTHYRRPAVLLARHAQEAREAACAVLAPQVLYPQQPRVAPPPRRAARHPQKAVCDNESYPLAVLAEDLEPWRALDSSPRIVRSSARGTSGAPPRQFLSCSLLRVAFIVGVAAFVIAAGAVLSVFARDEPAVGPTSAPKSPPIVPAAEPKEAPVEVSSPPAAASRAPRVTATPRAAVEALVAGRHREAHELYAALPVADAATWGVFQRVLARSSAQPPRAEAGP